MNPAEAAEAGANPALDVWQVDLQSDTLDQPQLLSADELDRYARLGRADTRRAWCRGRVALRRILGGILAAPPQALVFEYATNGKPSLASPVSGLEFNLSHCRDLCLVAVSRCGPVGIDVERVLPGRDHLALARRFFTPAEHRLLETTAEADLFYRLWALKEAHVKARGMNLLGGLDRFECRRSVDGGITVVDRADPAGSGRWDARLWTPRPGYIAALAVPCRAPAARQRRLVG